MENKIDLGTINLGEKGSALSGKKINLNFQLKISLNQNEDGNNVKVELLPTNLLAKQDAEKLDISGLKLDEASPEKNCQVRVNVEPEMKKISAKKFKERSAKYTDETDEFVEIDNERFNASYSQAKQELEDYDRYDDEE